MNVTENKIMKFLDKLKIKNEYEKECAIRDEQGKIKIWYPDFYLSELSIYIEVCGFEKEYDNTKKQNFDKNNIECIFLHTYKKNWKEYLIIKLKEINEKRVKKHKFYIQMLTSAYNG